jgi:hypothetical protein
MRIGSGGRRRVSQPNDGGPSCTRPGVHAARHKGLWVWRLRVLNTEPSVETRQRWIAKGP